MNNITIIPVEAGDIDALCAIAETVWTEHYTPIIGAAQVAYMVQKFQSPVAVRDQIANQNYRYYFLCLDGKKCGYTAIQPGNPDSKTLFLSKIYIDSQYRRNGLANAAVNFIHKLCVKEGYQKIWLTVNRNNSGSIAAYEKLGFSVTRTQAADIGNGYVMDDYIMETEVRSEE